MLTIVLLIVALIVFVVGIIRPHRAKRIERAAEHYLRPVEKWAEKKLPQPLRFLMKSPFWTSRRMTQVAGEKGRKTRKKLNKL